MRGRRHDRGQACAAGDVRVRLGHGPHSSASRRSCCSSTRAAARWCPRRPTVLKEFREHGHGRRRPRAATDELDHELFRHQLETRTDPTRDGDDAFAQLVAARRTAGEAARAAGLAAGACGTVPLAGDAVGGHVERPLPRHGRAVRRGRAHRRDLRHARARRHRLRRGGRRRSSTGSRRGCPILLALSANSPFVDGRDSGYASWRTQVWTRWPSAGPTEPFGSAEGYREACQALLDSGAARDHGMLYFDARLAVGHPTVEIRVCDVCTDPAEAVADRGAGPRPGRDRGPGLGRRAAGRRDGGPRRCARASGGRPGSVRRSRWSTRSSASCARRARCSRR